jgi:hypothetical protein
MRKLFPPDLLARDGRFVRLTNEERFNDPRGPRGLAGGRPGSKKNNRLTP